MRSLQKIPSIVLGITVILIAAVPSCGDTEETGASGGEEVHEVQEGVPTLMDLGSLTCVPCQMMEEELERLDVLTGDQLEVIFVDVNQDQAAAAQYGVRVIPTQIFLAPDGTELYRHEGYMSAEQMLARWIALGYDLNTEAEGRDAS